MPFELPLGNPLFRRLVLTVVVLLAAVVVAKFCQRLIVRYVDDTRRRYRASKLIGRTAAAVAFLAVVALWSPTLGGLLTVLGVVGAGLVIATREVLLSLVGWLDIALRTPFEQGDRIEVNGVSGDVVDIRLLHSTLVEIRGWTDADQSTGRLVHIPNSWIYQYAVYNYTRGFSFIWNELSVTVTFRSDWKAAREIILELAKESADIVERQAARQLHRLANEYLIHYSILTPFVYVRITENGVRLTLRYLCEARKRRGTAHAFTLEILDRFAEHEQIELVYSATGAKRFDTQFGPDEGPAFNPSPEQRAGSGAPDRRVP